MVPNIFILKPKTMSTKIKFYKLLAGMFFLGATSFAQVPMLEMTQGIDPNIGSPTGSGFGPRTTNHVVTFVQDVLNNSQFSSYAPAVQATFSLSNQFTGLIYGASTTNAVPTGLIFGAGPSLSTGGTIQQATPLNSYDIMGAYNGSGGPTNAMFTNVLPAGPGGIDATGDAAGSDVNSGVEVFTCAQVMYDQAQPYGTANRYYYGNLVISFNGAVVNPIIHIAGLGGSYRYLPEGSPNNPASYLSTFFSTELEYVGPGNLQKLSGNSYLTVSGKNILNNATIPNGGSTSNTGNFNNEGAATGSILVNAFKVTQLVFKVYLRGCDASQFGWSSEGIGVVSNATRKPLTGDIWYISTSLNPCVGCISLPSTGFTLSAALNGNDVSINWKTLTEINTRSFDIERSTDGVNYIKIGEKAAAGNSVSDINYSHIDFNMNSPVYYYRIKLIDLDNKVSYSNVVIVRKSMIKGIKTFPNPATDHVNIEFSNAKGSYNVALVNQLGQQVYSKKVDINNTVQYVRIERGTIPAGMYHVSIHDNNTGEVQSEKVLIK